jgi:hypothetical protein
MAEIKGFRPSLSRHGACEPDLSRRAMQQGGDYELIRSTTVRDGSRRTSLGPVLSKVKVAEWPREPRYGVGRNESRGLSMSPTPFWGVRCDRH